MQIIRLTSAILKQAVDFLKDGGIIVYPTDTAYALGADPANARAVAKIYKIKGREKKKPLPLIAASLDMVKRFFMTCRLERELAKKYWPAPLSLILRLRENHSHILQNMRISNLVVRVPKSGIARELSKKLGRPIISTSANVSGAGEFYNAKKIYKHFKDRKDKPDLILDGGTLRKRKPSTIIKVVGDKSIVLRQGQIKTKRTQER